MDWLHLGESETGNLDYKIQSLTLTHALYRTIILKLSEYLR
jgi:hypothetical protein